MRQVTYIRAPGDLSPQLKGLYERVARSTGVDAAYVKQVALGERESWLVEEALTRELARIAQRVTKTPSRHEVQFYSNDKVLTDRLVPFITAALKRGDPAVIVASRDHQNALARRLQRDGVDLDAASNGGRYVPVDAAGTLSIFMVNGTPEPSRFFRLTRGLIEDTRKVAKTAYPRVAVFGEWVSVLCQNGRADAAIRLEELWNHVAADYDLDLLCGYEMGSMNPGQHRREFKSICAKHSDVRIQEK